MSSSSIWFGVSVALLFTLAVPIEDLAGIIWAMGVGPFGVNGFLAAGSEGETRRNRDGHDQAGSGAAFGPDALASAFGPPDSSRQTSVDISGSGQDMASASGVSVEDFSSDFGGLEQAMRDLAHVERLRAAISSGQGDLWRFHGPIRDTSLLSAVHSFKTPVVSFLNSKGGVGKTTLAVNVAAYFARAGLRVLLVDLDDKAALTTTLMRAGRHQRRATSLADSIIAGTASPAWLSQMTIPLDMAGLDNARLVSSGPGLRHLELRMLVRWVIESDLADIRTYLARSLTDPQLRQSFDIILVDTPPRRDTATINAIVASTHVVIPTILDGLSIEGIGGLLHELKTWAREDLNPQLRLAGVVGTLTAGPMLSSSEASHRNMLAGIAAQVIGDQSAVFHATIPHRSAFSKCSGSGIAYHMDTGRNSVQDHVDVFGAELVQRLT